MKLEKGSDLIDAGRDLGYPFSGSQPDLGAFEYRTNTGANQIKTSNQNLSQKFSVQYSSLQHQLVIISQGNLNSEYQVSLYSIDGKLISEKRTIDFKNNSGPITKSNIHLTRGIYLLHLQSESENSTLRLRVTNQ
jgi:hypothetical protein